MSEYVLESEYSAAVEVKVAAPNDEEILREVSFTPSHLRRFGSPTNSGRAPFRYVLGPTWRSQLGNLLGYVATGYFSVVVSKTFPWLVVKGVFLSFASGTYYLHLPVAIFVPAIFMCRALLSVFDSKYIIDEQGIEAHIGLVSLSLRQPRLRFDDIRGVEPTQTISQRILGIGDLEIGSAMRDDVELIMEGVGNPRAVQLFINAEIERRTRERARSSD